MTENSATFKIVPLSLEKVSTIKSDMKDDFGNEVLEMLAMGKGPCRVSLKPFKIGIDRRLLFKHSPFDIDNIFNQPGPVFINKADVEPYQNIHQFPPAIIEDEDIPISLIGYSKEQMMVFTQKLSNDEKQNIDNIIGTIFKSHQEVSFLHARHSEACCYICKIERV